MTRPPTGLWKVEYSLYFASKKYAIQDRAREE